MRKRLFSRENTVFSRNAAGKTGYPHAIKMNLDAYITPHIKFNLNCINDLTIKAKTMKLSEENVGGKLHDT